MINNSLSGFINRLISQKFSINRTRDALKMNIECIDYRLIKLFMNVNQANHESLSSIGQIGVSLINSLFLNHIQTNSVFSLIFFVSSVVFICFVSNQKRDLFSIVIYTNRIHRLDPQILNIDFKRKFAGIFLIYLKDFLL